MDDFGETMNGITIYYLLNDIDFKDVDCTELKQIGYAQTNYYFSQIFDGQNHTLYNIPINSSNGTTGVFGAVNITGIVKIFISNPAKYLSHQKQEHSRRYKYFSRTQ